MNPREAMVGEIKRKYGLDYPKIFSAMLKVPREQFVDPKDRDIAYSDAALSIGYGQTISQPYTVAFMTSLLELDDPTSHKATRGKKVLEIGTGSGYQAAVLSLLANKVYTVERIPQLAKEAKRRLKRLGFENVKVRTGSGEFGWKEYAPFDAIIVTAGVKDGATDGLLKQLKDSGVLVAPVGEGEDKVMTKYVKTPLRTRLRGAAKNYKISRKEYGIFHFVPFITAFKKTPTDVGDELNADMSSSLGRGNRGLRSAKDVIEND